MAHSHEHHYGHSHSIGSGHDHGPATFDRAFAIGTVLNMGIVLAELWFGYLAHSLALMADAAHNLSDVAGLLLAWGAAWLPSQPDRGTNVWLPRASILAALSNAALLLVATGGIAVEAIRRFAEPQQLEASTVIWVAALAIVLNGIAALISCGAAMMTLTSGARSCTCWAMRQYRSAWC